MFTSDNTNDLYSADLLDEMNAALDQMLGDDEGDLRIQNEKNYSGWIMEIAEDGMTADQIVAACR